MLLVDVDKDACIRITGFADGKGVESKLRQLGIIPGETIVVIRVAPLGGPLLLDVQGRTVAIGKGVASKIEVENIECDSS